MRDIKNVLIPTDFSTRSLETIDQVADLLPEKLNIYLFHAFDMPASLLEAMSRAGINAHNNLITEELRQKCKRIKINHQNITNISFRTMYGTTNAVFEHYTKANNINLIALPAGYKFVSIFKDSVNPERMFKKSGIEILTISAVPMTPNAAPEKAIKKQEAIFCKN
ncbi:MAG: hypothetical protein K9G49_03390 [Taibaiella sp.]|nr:hypothetical protein [Taibaiella sp.]